MIFSKESTKKLIYSLLFFAKNLSQTNIKQINFLEELTYDKSANKKVFQINESVFYKIANKNAIIKNFFYSNGTTSYEILLSGSFKTIKNVQSNDLDNLPKQTKTLNIADFKSKFVNTIFYNLYILFVSFNSDNLKYNSSFTTVLNNNDFNQTAIMVLMKQFLNIFNSTNDFFIIFNSMNKSFNNYFQNSENNLIEDTNNLSDFQPYNFQQGTYENLSFYDLYDYIKNCTSLNLICLPTQITFIYSNNQQSLLFDSFNFLCNILQLERNAIISTIKIFSNYIYIQSANASASSPIQESSPISMPLEQQNYKEISVANKGGKMTKNYYLRKRKAYKNKNYTRKQQKGGNQAIILLLTAVAFLGPAMRGPNGFNFNFGSQRNLGFMALFGLSFLLQMNLAAANTANSFSSVSDEARLMQFAIDTKYLSQNMAQYMLSESLQQPSFDLQVYKPIQNDFKSWFQQLKSNENLGISENDFKAIQTYLTSNEAKSERNLYDKTSLVNPLKTVMEQFVPYEMIKIVNDGLTFKENSLKNLSDADKSNFSLIIKKFSDIKSALDKNNNLDLALTKNSFFIDIKKNTTFKIGNEVISVENFFQEYFYLLETKIKLSQQMKLKIKPIPSLNIKLTSKNILTLPSSYYTCSLSSSETCNQINLDEGNYTGDLYVNIPNGKGMMTYKDGTTYDGDWYEGKPNGEGTKTVNTETTKTIFKGTFEKGIFKNGIKTVTQGKGLISTTYKGTFNDAGELSGDYLTFTNNILTDSKSFVRANFTNGKIIEIDGVAKGSIYTIDNNNNEFIEYFGGLQNNYLKHGYGNEYYSDNQLKYSGFFDNNLQKGKGTSYDLYGNIVFEGLWSNNKMKKGKLNLQNNITYEADFIINDSNENVATGAGIVFYYLEGFPVKVTTTFINNRPTGSGQLEFVNDKSKGIFQGLWNNNVFEPTQKITFLPSEYEQEIISLKSKITSLEQFEVTNEVLNREIIKLNNELKALETANNVDKAEVKKLKELVKSLTEDITTELSKRHTELFSDLSQANEKLKLAKTEASEKDLELQSLQKEITTLKTEITRLTEIEKLYTTLSIEDSEKINKINIGSQFQSYSETPLTGETVGYITSFIQGKNFMETQKLFLEPIKNQIISFLKTSSQLTQDENSKSLLQKLENPSSENILSIDERNILYQLVEISMKYSNQPTYLSNANFFSLIICNSVNENQMIPVPNTSTQDELQKILNSINLSESIPELKLNEIITFYYKNIDYTDNYFLTLKSMISQENYDITQIEEFNNFFRANQEALTQFFENKKVSSQSVIITAQEVFTVLHSVSSAKVIEINELSYPNFYSTNAPEIYSQYCVVQQPKVDPQTLLEELDAYKKENKMNEEEKQNFENKYKKAQEDLRWSKYYQSGFIFLGVASSLSIKFFSDRTISALQKQNKEDIEILEKTNKKELEELKNKNEDYQNAIIILKKPNETEPKKETKNPENNAKGIEQKNERDKIWTFVNRGNFNDADKIRAKQILACLYEIRKYEKKTDKENLLKRRIYEIFRLDKEVLKNVLGIRGSKDLEGIPCEQETKEKLINYFQKIPEVILGGKKRMRSKTKKNKK